MLEGIETKIMKQYDTPLFLSPFIRVTTEKQPKHLRLLGMENNGTAAPTHSGLCFRSASALLFLPNAHNNP